MHAIKRTTVGLILAVALLGGLVTSSSAAPAVAPLPMPAVEVDWSLWLMGPYAKFDRGETETIANMSVVSVTAYAASKVPAPWGKVAAAALGAGLWSAAKQAVQRGGQCVILIWAVLYRGVRTTNC